ncbi:di-heme oxidoredictase family protein [Zhongshania sp.]|uniref:di-heme oxidoredictase family protein n=1 Tax=Zhongshania sp. TaxID=1971902 RepID=UPI003569E107
MSTAMLYSCAIGLSACKATPPLPLVSGASFTVAPGSPRILEQPQPQLSLEQKLDWAVGKSFANQAWVSAPASTTARDGLGPLFNANSCVACHQRNGQGQLPEHGPGLILRIAPVGLHHKSYGEQLQDHALLGSQAEGQIAWRETPSPAKELGDQQDLSYRQYFIANANYGDTSDMAFSPRLAPALIGLGLLDSIPDQTLIARSDPNDLDQNGISGRVLMRWDEEQQRLRPGRFGWKASQASLKQQVALAFSQDIGIRSPIYPMPNCPVSLINCDQEFTHDKTQAPEISTKLLNAVSRYIANLAVPGVQNSPNLQRGYKHFISVGCADCHIPATETRPAPFSLFGQGNNIETRKETIYPFSDLLLHDMGAGLADSAATDNTPAAEWRTAPLWGLGMRSQAGDNIRLLHDGRAKSLTEAILWHGGEAALSRKKFLQLDPSSQNSLLNFLKAL